MDDWGQARHRQRVRGQGWRHVQADARRRGRQGARSSAARPAARSPTTARRRRLVAERVRAAAGASAPREPSATSARSSPSARRRRAVPAADDALAARREAPTAAAAATTSPPSPTRRSATSERLYHKAKASEYEKIEKAEAAEQARLAECTFRPQVLPRAAWEGPADEGDAASEDVHERLYPTTEAQVAARRKLEDKHLSTERAQCTFTPRIAPAAVVDVEPHPAKAAGGATADERPSQPVHERLFDESRRQAVATQLRLSDARNNEITADCTFAPNIKSPMKGAAGGGAVGQAASGGAAASKRAGAGADAAVHRRLSLEASRRLQQHGKNARLREANTLKECSFKPAIPTYQPPGAPERAPAMTKASRLRAEREAAARARIEAKAKPAEATRKPAVATAESGTSPGTYGGEHIARLAPRCTHRVAAGRDGGRGRVRGRRRRARARVGDRGRRKRGVRTDRGQWRGWHVCLRTSHARRGQRGPRSPEHSRSGKPTWTPVSTRFSISSAPIEPFDGALDLHARVARARARSPFCAPTTDAPRHARLPTCEYALCDVRVHERLKGPSPLPYRPCR